MGFLREWFHRHFSDPQVVGLATVLVVGTALVLLAGQMLAPVIASVIIAYLLEGLVGYLQRRGMPRIVAVAIVFCAFMAVLFFTIFALLPLLSRQVAQLVQQLPAMLTKGQALLLTLPERYPELFSQEQVYDLIANIRAEALAFGQRAVSVSVASVVGVITVLVYLVLVPLLVFFFLKDKVRIVAWLTAFLPDERKLVSAVWHDTDLQIGNYVRGKFFEITIVGIVTYVVFGLMSLEFALLLAALVGLSVLIPYIGAAAVTLPVALIAYFQWGPTSETAWLLAAYGIIQALDGNVLVPLLFSEVVNLHPVAIIVAILVFGGLWGFWGVFFAIPLATVVQAVLKAWPSLPKPDDVPSEPVESS